MHLTDFLAKMSIPHSVSDANWPVIRNLMQFHDVDAANMALKAAGSSISCSIRMSVARSAQSSWRLSGTNQFGREVKKGMTEATPIHEVPKCKSLWTCELQVIQLGSKVMDTLLYLSCCLRRWTPLARQVFFKLFAFQAGDCLKP